MFFTGISIAFVIMVIIAIFIYRDFYLKKNKKKNENSGNE
jgi:hypothetical protein